MKRMIPFFAAAFALSACGADPVAACEDYTAALATCAEEAAGTAATGSGTTTVSSGCELFDGLKGSEAKDVADAYNCAGDAVAAADCSTQEGYTAAFTDAGTCITGI